MREHCRFTICCFQNPSNQTNGLFEESGHNSGAANLFFTLAYQSVKQSLSNDDKRALFVLSPSQDLEAAQPQWYIEQEQADSE